MIKFFGSVRITVGAVTSTPGSASIWSPRLSCITALENAKKMGEFGGCTRISAPTPSTRFPHSEMTPEVRPTIIRTKITWMAMAMTLRKDRSRRATMLPQNICSSEKGPSKVSFILRFRALTLSHHFKGQTADVFCGQQHSCRISRKIFLSHEVFNTSVDKLVGKSSVSKANYTILSTLMRFALFKCNCATPSTNSFQSGAEGSIAARIFLRQSKKFPIVFGSETLTLVNSNFQYQRGGFSKCTLMVCFASVMSYQRPYVFQPSPTT